MPNYQDQLDTVFQALADGNRRAMIDHLSKGDLSVSDLSAPLGISLPATLQHLSVLEAAGLVQSRKLGRVRTCSLDRTALSQAEKWIHERRQFWENRLDALGEFLAEPDNTKAKEDL
jgi:DNA-binding transcriptional ArsR family regulator